MTWQGRAALYAGRDRPGVGDDGCCGEAELRVLNSSLIETALEPPLSFKSDDILKNLPLRTFCVFIKVSPATANTINTIFVIMCFKNVFFFKVSGSIPLSKYMLKVII